MADRKGHLQIDVLGTSFAIEADEHSEYLQTIYRHYKKVVSEVQQTSGVNDYLKIAIIAGILLSDELAKERLNPQTAAQGEETELISEQSVQKMIEDIDSIIYSVAKSDAEPQ